MSKLPLLLLAAAPLFAQLESHTLAISATRSINLQPDQVVFGLSVSSAATAEFGSDRCGVVGGWALRPPTLPASTILYPDNLSMEFHAGGAAFQPVRDNRLPHETSADHRSKQQRPDVDVCRRGNAGIAAIAAIAIVLQRRSYCRCNGAGAKTGSRGWIDAGADTPESPTYPRSPNLCRPRRMSLPSLGSFVSGGFSEILLGYAPSASDVLAACQISVVALILTLQAKGKTHLPRIPPRGFQMSG